MGDNIQQSINFGSALYYQWDAPRRKQFWTFLLTKCLSFNFGSALFYRWYAPSMKQCWTFLLTKCLTWWQRLTIHIASVPNLVVVAPCLVPRFGSSSRPFFHHQLQTQHLFGSNFEQNLRQWLAQLLAICVVNLSCCQPQKFLSLFKELVPSWSLVPMLLSPSSLSSLWSLWPQIQGFLPKNDRNMQRSHEALNKCIQ